MTSPPLEHPVRPSDAAALAGLLYQRLENQPLNDEVRASLSEPVAALSLRSLSPLLPSLERDPTQTFAWFLAVDALRDDTRFHYLLRIAPASAADSSLFPDAFLLGRLRPSGSREIVVSLVPFAPGDSAVPLFAEQINPSFLPRPQRARATIDASDPIAAFPAFHKILNQYGVNLAATANAPLSLWAAIRTGYREGYTVIAPPGPLDAIGEHPFCTRFPVFSPSALQTGNYDLELCLPSGDMPAVAILAPQLTGEETEQELQRLANGATLSLRYLPNPTPEFLRRLNKATAGRYAIPADTEQQILSLAEQLHG
jgi:hypothetical protein